MDKNIHIPKQIGDVQFTLNTNICVSKEATHEKLGLKHCHLYSLNTSPVLGLLYLWLGLI